MKKAWYIYGLSILLILVLSSSLFPGAYIKPVLAYQKNLQWDIIDTPSTTNNVVISPSEINTFSIGVDGITFYAVDIPGDPAGGTYPNGKIYKSEDAGITWDDDITLRLTAEGANFPVWNIAIPDVYDQDDKDDVNLIVAVTDGTGAPNGPKQVFISEDGGTTWQDSSFPALAATEFISCVDISMEYENGKRDIAVGTRQQGSLTGTVWILRKTDTGIWGWKDQRIAPSTGWVAGDVVALKFSPNYIYDSRIIVVSATSSGTILNNGVHDPAANQTSWNSDISYPVTIIDTNYSGTSPTQAQIITADLELPSDFLGSNTSLSRYYISTDTGNNTSIQSGIYRLDNTVVNRIKPPSSGRISSIAYYGEYQQGKIIAGEVTTDNSTGIVDIWYSSNPVEDTASAVEWERSDSIKSPTGGGNSGYANALVTWSPDGTVAYTGTSSADFSTGGTSITTAGTWPLALTNSYALDESAFSISQDEGNIWNQLSLIDTEMSFLSDVAALEVPEDSESYDILYVASISDNSSVSYNFDSVWRSTSSTLGTIWQRILCTDTSDNGIIIRVDPRTSEEEPGIVVRSNVVVFADTTTDDVRFSADEGQYWIAEFTPPLSVTDISLASENTMYILDNTSVYRGSYSDENWEWPGKYRVDTGLNSGHTITTPLKNPERTDEIDQDWVIVGDAGQGEIAYADFSRIDIEDISYSLEFEPPPEERKPVPVPGNMHVVADNNFQQNKIIYAASHDLPSGTISGKIYRWSIGESTEWDELEPPNSAFFGFAQRNDVLYGAWNVPTGGGPVTPGIDRTLFPRAHIPPPIEWDDLTTGLPVSGDINYPVSFTREPNSLKISSNTYNNLWVIDNNRYNWTNKIGCLWTYSDTIAKIGPWTTSPPSNDYILIDPVTGRADEINFRWRQLEYAYRYQLQIAKDKAFSLMLMDTENIIPSDPVSPSWILFPGNLENNHIYYWRVRARQAITGEVIRSPWSATMFFTVHAGLATDTTYLGPHLLAPDNGCGCPCNAPISFSWSPFQETTEYKFELSENADMSEPLVSTTVSGTTSYEYQGEVKCNTNYFWHVIATAPWPSEWSATFSFQTQDQPAPSAVPVYPQSKSTPFWIWIIVFIFIALVSSIGFLFKTTRAERFNMDLNRSLFLRRFGIKEFRNFFRVFYNAVNNIRITVKRMIIRNMK